MKYILHSEFGLESILQKGVRLLIVLIVSVFQMILEIIKIEQRRRLLL